LNAELRPPYWFQLHGVTDNSIVYVAANSEIYILTIIRRALRFCALGNELLVTELLGCSYGMVSILIFQACRFPNEFTEWLWNSYGILKQRAADENCLSIALTDVCPLLLARIFRQISFG
jgi:hypothetical protein